MNSMNRANGRNKQKLLYLEPCLEITDFDTPDVILTSEIELPGDDYDENQ